MRAIYRYSYRRLQLQFKLIPNFTRHFSFNPELNSSNNIIINPHSSETFNTQKQSHEKTQFNSIDKDIVKWNTTITHHMKRGQWELARNVFESMPRRNVVSWNAMVSGYLSNGRFEEARQLFDEMPVRDVVSWNLMLNGYVRSRDFVSARELFERMPERDVVSWNTMLSGYARCGFVDEARELFDRMPVKNDISWNGLLVSYVQNGKVDEARVLFELKEGWEVVSWNCLMGGYVKKNRLVEARELFDRMHERDVVSWNTMISGHVQNGDVLEARSLFEESPFRDVFTWTTMVSGYVQNGLLDEARRMFDQMPEKNVVSWNSMIAGYVQYKRMDLARELFQAMPTRNVSSWNAMITGYAQSGDLAQAMSLFNRMPQRDSISWSAIIAGYSQSGQSEEALRLFVEMQRNGELSNKSVFTCVLSTCADIGVLELGMQVHGHLVKGGFEKATYVGNSVLAMYCKCGSIDEAYSVFEGIIEKDTVSWNTMISGYARHGFGQEALMIFEAMTKAGAQADDATMIAVLSACAHAGLVDRGREYFRAMYSDYGIVASPRHYACMIDLLCRAGRLDEAENLVAEMPSTPDAATWGALLGASRVHGNMELAEKAAKNIFEMEPDNSGMYVLLSNSYAASGRWDNVRQIRLKMTDKGVKKVPGYSWLEVQNKIHTFSAGDTCHPETVRIYTFLEELESRMKQDGYVSSVKLVLHDVDDEEKEHMLKYHSERLAVAFGILTIPHGKPIRVMKNLRICEDCHTAIKHISRLERRLIIIRDSNRFHHFKQGSCSCGDYW